MYSSCKHRAAWRVAVLWIVSYFFSLLSKRAWKRSNSSLTTHIYHCLANKRFPLSYTLCNHYWQHDSSDCQIYNPSITFRLKLVFKFLVSMLCLNFCLLFWGSDLSCLLTHRKACKIQALEYQKKSENCYFLSESLSVILVTHRSTTHW